MRKIQFKSEISQLMDILIHSLYKEREIFLRELISNSVDALNKMKIKSLTETGADKEIELKIKIETDKENNILKVIDTGIGMTETELVENIGTIAHSGSKAFLEKIKSEDLAKDLIGQFGVGFYSVFMVADKVEVYSQSFRESEKTALWVSEGKADFSVTTLDEKRERGTEIKIYLKKDAKEFLEPERIKLIVNRYSKFVDYPIFVNGEELEKVEPLWTAQPTNVEKEKYIEFYKYLTHGEAEPLTYIHVNSDAPVDLKALLFVPPFSMLKFGIEEETGVKLYCRKVLIEEKAEDIIPPYFKFLKGIVDSEDIELNVSRESIQNNLVISKIKKNLTKRIIKKLKEFLKKDREKYETFYKEFGAYLKDGVVRDLEAREGLASLLLFNVTGDEKLISLDEYLEQTENKKVIYYLTATDLSAAEKSPHLEYYKEKNLPVVILTDPLDEFAVEHLNKYKDAEFKSVSKEEETKEKELKEEQKEFLKKAKEILKERAEDVRYSDKLVSSPYCVVAGKYGLSSSMEKFMQMTNKDFTPSKKILELNPNHDLIKNLEKLITENENLGQLILHQMLDNALLLDNQNTNVTAMVERFNQILEKAVLKK